MKNVKTSDHEIKYSSEGKKVCRPKWYMRKKQQIKHNTIEFRFQNSDERKKEIQHRNAFEMWMQTIK